MRFVSALVLGILIGWSAAAADFPASIEGALQKCVEQHRIKDRLTPVREQQLNRCMKRELRHFGRIGGAVVPSRIESFKKELREQR